MIIDVDNTTFQIGDMITTIEDNSRHISLLNRQRNKRAERISANLDLLRRTKKHLSQEQVQVYATYSLASAQQDTRLRLIMAEIDKRKGLPNVRRQLLNPDTDFAAIYTDLEEVAAYQREAIAALSSILQSADYTLSSL